MNILTDWPVRKTRYGEPGWTSRFDSRQQGRFERDTGARSKLGLESPSLLSPRLGSRMEMPPAWRVTYRIQLAGLPDDMLTEVKWRGEMQGGRFEFRECNDESAVGDVSVLSAQPYKDDALRECDRLVRDACSMLAVDRWRPFLARQPPVEVVPMAGASGDSHREGVRISVGASAKLEMHLGKGKDLPAMAAAVARTPELRADCDTFALAMGEPDEPTRLVTLYRLYDRLAGLAMEHEPRLFTDDEVNAVVHQAFTALDARHADDPATHRRIEQTLRNAFARLRATSRPQAVADHLSGDGNGVDPEVVKRIDGERGKFAHRGAQAATPVDSEVLTTVQRIVVSELTAQLEDDSH